MQAMAVDGGGYRARTEMKLEENRKIEEQVENFENRVVKANLYRKVKIIENEVWNVANSKLAMLFLRFFSKF